MRLLCIHPYSLSIGEMRKEFCLGSNRVKQAAITPAPPPLAEGLHSGNPHLLQILTVRFEVGHSRLDLGKKPRVPNAPFDRQALH